MSDPFPPLMHEVLAERARRDPDRTVLDFESRTLTFAELHEGADRLAAALAGTGVGKGDRVAVMLGNRPEMAVVQYGLARAGAVLVPVSTAMRGDPLARYFADSGARTAIIEAGLVDRVRSALGGLGPIDRLITADAAAPGAERLEELLRAPVPATWARPRIEPWDLWSVMYTSGTTGPAKGVMLSHRFLGRQVQTGSELSMLHERSVIFSPAPLYHLQAIALAMHAAVAAGCRAIIRAGLPREDPLAELARLGVTTAFLPPFVLLGQPAPAEDAPPASSLETVLTVGLTAEQWAAVERRLRCRVVGAYGPTETGLITRFLNDGADRPGTSGRRSSHVEVEVVDEHDRILPHGEVGEVVCRPRHPNELMEGYLNLPEKTVEAWHNLWFHTGDAGRFDADGSFVFADRVKDMIKHHGFSISSFDVEQALLKHPGIADAAVVPVRVHSGEEDVRAFVVPRPGVEVDLAELIAFVNERLAHYMVPRFVDVVATIPRSQLGKVEKLRLREEPVSERTFDRRAAGIELRR